MYLELTPQDTLRDLQRLLVNAIPGFEFPRVNLYDYQINTILADEDSLGDEDFSMGPIWNDMSENKTEQEEQDEENYRKEYYFLKDPVWNEMSDDNIIFDDNFPNKVIVEKSEFKANLTSEEIEILAILMMIGWLQRQITSIENTRMKYSGSDFKMTSQANHLSKLQSLLGECQRQSHHMQRLYKRRELNEEGRYQSTWNWFGKHGATGNR